MEREIDFNYELRHQQKRAHTQKWKSTRTLEIRNFLIEKKILFIFLRERERDRNPQQQQLLQKIYI